MGAHEGCPQCVRMRDQPPSQHLYPARYYAKRSGECQPGFIVVGCQVRQLQKFPHVAHGQRRLVYGIIPYVRGNSTVSSDATRGSSAECGKSARMHLRPIGASRSGPHFRLSMNRKTMIAAPRSLHRPPSSSIALSRFIAY